MSFFICLVRFSFLSAFFLSIFVSCNNGSENAIILEDGVYFDGDTFISFKEIFLENGKIASISSHHSKSNAERISLKGKYLIPGLIDAHVHLAGCPTMPFINIQSEFNAGSSLNCGVTTVVDLFFDEKHVKKFKSVISRSPELYSSVIMSGPMLTAPGGHGTEYGVEPRTITSISEAEKVVKAIADSIDVFKVVYEKHSSKPSIDLEVIKHIVRAAHIKSKKVFAHIDRSAEAVDCAIAGVDVLAHLPRDVISNEQLKTIKALGIIVTPTMSVAQSHHEGYGVPFISDSLLRTTAYPGYLEMFEKDKPVLAPDLDATAMAVYRRNLVNFIRWQIPIVAGTDAGNFAVFYGYSLHNEIYQYTLAGMTNSEALRTATSNIQLVFPEMKIGRIKVGYDADLLVLNGDPILNIENTKSIAGIFHKGRVVKRLISKSVKQIQH